MFYTLVSRSIITKINTPRDYFYIFLLGSVGYVILHWYLHMEKRDGIIEKVREYLYYAMVIDIITAYVWMVLSPVKTDKKEDSNDETKNKEQYKDHDENQYTPEQKKLIMQKMQEARRLQQIRQKELLDQRANEAQELPSNNQQNRNSDDKTPEDKKTPEPKKSIFSKSEDSRDSKESEPSEQSENSHHTNAENKNDVEKPSSDVVVKGKKKTVNRQDTDIPVYEGQKKRSDVK
jgi:type IV secretory pathway VirB10-like protein